MARKDFSMFGLYVYRSEHSQYVEMLKDGRIKRGELQLVGRDMFSKFVKAHLANHISKEVSKNADNVASQNIYKESFINESLDKVGDANNAIAPNSNNSLSNNAEEWGF